MKDTRKPARLTDDWWKRLDKLAPKSIKGYRNRSTQVKWVIELAEEVLTPRKRPNPPPTRRAR